MIAVVLESGDLQRLYTGLSLLVSAAAEGVPARGLVMFAALAPLLDDDLAARAAAPGAAPAVAEAGRPAFAATLAGLRDAARELDACRLLACSAAVELTGTDAGRVRERLDGIVSTPRFLEEVGDARLVVV